MVFKELGNYADLIAVGQLYDTYYIGIDIGGTNTRVVCATRNGDYYYVEKFLCSRVSTLVENLNNTINKMKSDNLSYPKAVVIDLAGPHISKDVYKLTNYIVGDNQLDVTLLNWKREDIHVLNDLESGAYGIVPYIKMGQENEIFSDQLTGVKKDLPKGVYSVLAAGTGLGVGLICFNGDKYDVIPSEFGHISICTVDKEDELLFEKLKAYLKVKEPTRTNFNLEYEDMVSGRGIKALYELNKSETDPILENVEIAKLASENLEKNPNCPAVKALYLHYKYLFRAAKEVGVGIFSSGTYLLGDNIVKNNKVVSHFKKELVSEYNNHYKADWLQKIPIYPQKIEANLNLVGTIYYAIHKANAN